MQKIAVALTTQEEFNEYMNYIDNSCYSKGKRIIRCGNDAWSWHGENTCMELNGEYTKIMHISGAEESGYKIISLKEAIGENENKEIIREGEARGKKYKHKTLGREAKQMDDKPDYYYIYKQLGKGAMSASKTSRESDYPNREIVYCIDKQLIESSSDWEPIEEPKRDWFKKAYDYYQTPMPARHKSNDVRYPMKFREAIEKHMPKVNESDIQEWLEGIFGIDYQMKLGIIKQSLKSKGLLE